jgi:putative salt-induced outer membrane protein
VNLATGLEAKVSDRLSTRLSYAVDYNSNPPAGRGDTDTISRFSLVYGF